METAGDRLPAELSSFVGRSDELSAIAEALAGSRLVTLTGPGGCGKTRLAIRTARAVEGLDGAYWADLSSTGDPESVPELVAAALGALRAVGRDAVELVAGQLADRRLLLCLDNCEHVLEAAGAVARELMRRCPSLTLLCTSREPLRVPGETVWRVPQMRRAEAVELFGMRAGLEAAGSDPSVAAACARMEGMPLAIELAAAWSATLSSAEILAGLEDRFRLLVRGPHGVAARHQTLAASLDWSHGLLSEEDRRLFARLAAFRGGFGVAAAQDLCADETTDRDEVLHGLRRLVEKSLLTADTGGEAARFRMLETVREYAERRLTDSGEADSIRDLHLESCLDQALTLRRLAETDKEAWRAVVAVDYENFRAALRWGLALDDPERSRRLAAELPWFWHSSRHGREGLELLRRAVDLGAGQRTPLQARLLTGLALVADTAAPASTDAGPARRAFELAEEVGDERSACLALTLRAIAEFGGDLQAVWDLAVEAEERGGRIGDAFVSDAAKVLQGIVCHLRDDHGKASALLEGGLTGLVARGDRGVASTASALLAVGIAHSGDLRRARDLALEALRLAEPLEDYHRVGTARVVLARMEELSGRLDEAWAAVDPVLRIIEGTDPAPFVPGLFNCIGRLNLAAGAPERARQWFERDLGFPAGVDSRLRAPQSRVGLALALGRLGDPAAIEHARTALHAARDLGMPGLAADAIEAEALVLAAIEPRRAEDRHHEALAIRAEHDLRLQCVHSLERLAALAAEAGARVEAGRLIGACDRAREEFGHPRFEQIHVVETDAREEGRSMTLEEAVAYARRARGGRSRPASGWGSLTPTELSVVELAITGMTNPEIAAKLFMSRATVKTHLSHAYSKLGIANRTQLASVKRP